MASLIPYLSGLLAVLLTGWTLASLRPLSPLRPFMLSIILAAATTTAVTAPTSSANSPWNCFVGLYFGAVFAVEAIDHVCVSRLYFDAEKCSKDGDPTGFLTVVWWTADAIWNKRNVGTSRQVKNVPLFNSGRPEYVPSRVKFLLVRVIRFITTCLVLDFATSIPAQEVQEQFGIAKEPLLGRMAAGEVAIDELVERTILILVYAFMCYAAQLAVSDLFAIIAVGSFLNDPAYWPPRFGSLSDAYTIRRFWGVFWHQEISQALKSNARFMVYEILQIPKTSLIGRYASLFFAFFISGLIHINNDRFLKVPLRESGALYFFPIQAIGIMVEDVVQRIFNRLTRAKGSARSGVGKPPLWQRLLGYIWVLLFFIWQAPSWAYPIMRQDNPLPLPGSLWKSRG